VTDFAPSEFEGRTIAARLMMETRGLDAILLNTEAEIRYFTGFRTLFWQSPTRPWFLVLPREGDPIAVIPTIGADLMARTWVKDIRTWNSPDPQDEGISLLAGVLGPFQRVGLPMGQESSLRMPLGDLERLRTLAAVEFVDATPLVRALRMVKSPAEIDLIREICTIASDTFERAGELFFKGQALSEAFRAFKIALLSAGAEEVPYLVGGAGPGGYGDVISPPDATALGQGDVLMLDTGATLKGYFCDFDRNFAIGRASQPAKDAYTALWNATEAGLAAARPGVSCEELFDAMSAELPKDGAGVGRSGHGLGMQLTEWPSIRNGDRTVLKPGMVMTLEPSLVVAPGLMMVHEENILITEDAPELLTKRAAQQLPVI